MNIKKMLFLCAIAITQAAVAAKLTEAVGIRKQLQIQVHDAELPEALISSYFKYLKAFPSNSTTSLRGFIESENLAQALIETLPKISSESLYRLSIKAHSELTTAPKDLYSSRLKSLIGRVDLELKGRGVLTPEQGAGSLKKVAVTEKLLSLCYLKHPLLQEFTMQVTDVDFENSKLSAERKARVRKDLNDSPKTLLYCYNSVLGFAQAQGDNDTLKHFATRLSEVREVINAQSGQATTNQLRMGSAR